MNKNLNNFLFYSVCLLIVIQVIITLGAKSYYSHIVDAFKLYNLDKTFVVYGEVNEAFSPDNFAIEGKMPLITKDSLNALKELPFLESIMVTGHKYYDVKVNNKKFGGVWIRTVEKGFLSTFNLIENNRILDQSKMTISKLMAEKWEVKENLQVTAQLTIPSEVTDQLDDEVKNQLLKNYKPIEVDIGTILSIGSTGIKFIDELVIIDRQFAIDNLSNFLIEPTILFIQTNSSMNTSQIKLILSNYFENSVDKIIPEMKIKVDYAGDYLKPFISEKALSRLILWLSLFTLVAIAMVVTFMEVGRFSYIQQEIALRRTYGATVFSAIYFTLFNRLVSNSLALIVGVMLGLILLSYIAHHYSFSINYTLSSNLYFLASYSISILIPLSIMIKAATIEPKLILCRDY